MHQAGDHGVDDQDQQDEADAEEDEADGPGDALPAFPFVPDAVLVEPVFGDEAVIPALALVEHLGLGDAAGEDHGVHRELLEPEVGVEEVDGEDEAGGQQGLVGVDDQRDVDDPAGQEAW